jgi:hypothetical protein
VKLIASYFLGFRHVRWYGGLPSAIGIDAAAGTRAGQWEAAAMGVIVEFATVPIEQRAHVLRRIAASGVEVEDEGDARGVYWFGCRRGRASIGLAFDPSLSRNNVCLYCRYLDFLWRPHSVRRLFRDVLTVVRFSVPEAGV